ncbi:gypsy type transposase, partial [Tanacetum coccineum]
MEKNINIIDTTDRISELPEFILHHILSLSKSPVDLVRCSALSKKWFTLTAFFPVLNFNLDEFTKSVRASKSSHRTHFGAAREMFYEYIAYTTSRFCEQNASVHTFNLDTRLRENTCRVPTPKCRLPNLLLSASSLTSLTVSYCELPSWSMVVVVKFKSLKLLHLREVPLDEEVIKCLNASCPLLEKLNVEYGSGLKRLCIYGLQKLQKVRVHHVNGLETVDIEAPNLRECHISFIDGRGRGAPPSLNLALCKQLTTLRLSEYPFPTPKGFADFLSNFPLLENLFLSIPNQCNSLSLSNPSLRKVVLHVRCDLENIDINSRNLLLFTYLGYADPYERDAPESKSRMNCCPGNDVDTLWFQKLRRFLDKTNRFNDLMLIISVGSINIEQLKLIHSLPYELEHVELELISTHTELSVYVAVVEAVLWCCRPRCITLISDFSSIDFEQQSHVVKFMYQKLLQQEDQDEINIQFVLSSSSKVKMNFSDLNLLLTALPHEKPRKTITFVKEEDIRCVLTWKTLDAFCDKFYIPEEVHPVLLNQNDTMHGRPAGKIGLYTRFFDYANFRLPLSTFLVDVLRHFRINISQLSVIGAAKVSHFEIMCRVYGIIPTVGLFRCFYVNSKKSGWMSFSKRSDNAPVCYTKPLDSLKNSNNHFFWVDDFACPAFFSWHTAKHVTRDPDPVAADFNAQDYATLVAHPSPFRKFSEAFLCLVGLSRHYTLDEETNPRFLHKNGEEMDIFAFIHTPDHTKLLLIVLKASVERLFDKDGSGNQTEQGDSARGGQDANIQPVVEAADTVVEVVAPVQPRRQGKRKSVVVDAGGASHPPTKLREDHGTPSGTSVGGKSWSAIKRLLAGAVLNAEVRVTAIPTLPFMTASVSSTPKREGGDHTDSVAEPNLRTIGASQRFVISSDSSHHSGPAITEVEVDSLVRSSAPIMTTVTTVTSTVDPASVAKEKPVDPSLFYADSSSAGGTDPTTGVFSDRTGNDFLVGAIRTVIDPDTDLQKVYVPQWSVTNGSCLDDGRVCHEMVDEFAPPKFFASVRGMEHDQLFTEFNVGAARQMYLSAEVRMCAEYNVKEKRRSKSVFERQGELLKVREKEIENLKAQLLLREAEAAEAIRLRAEASNFGAIEKSLRDETNALKERTVILEKERNALDVKVTELEASAANKGRALTDLNALVTSVKSQNDILVDRV